MGSRMRSGRPGVAAARAAVAVALVAGLGLARAAAAVAPADAPALRIRVLGTVVGGADERVRLGDPSGLAVDAFGVIYVTDAALHRMQRFD